MKNEYGKWLKLGTLSLLLVGESYAAKVIDSYRYARYCEVIVGKGLRASVYTSFTLNDCPQNKWRNIDIKTIKSQNKASFVYLNGPRHFIIDKYVFKRSVPMGDEKYFAGIKMRKVADVKIGLSDIVKGFRPYIEHKVYRDTVWIYKSGRPVYELISPQNKVYVMQSYSDELKVQNDKSLAQLAKDLHLPRGWRFKTGVLKKDAELATENKMAIVTQDSLKNTYQLAKRDLLNFEYK